MLAQHLATFRAYGRSGYRTLGGRHLDLAQRVARRAHEAPDLQRLAAVPLKIVYFRFRPPGVNELHLDELNQRLGEAILADVRAYLGTTEPRVTPAT
jgi:glutamate/tyrosine decarboxylase-like PLP-dependent enzyme